MSVAVASAVPSTRSPARAEGLAWPIWLFLASMIVPAEFAFEAAGLNISPQRLVLLVFALGIARWVWRTRAPRRADWLVVAASLWALAATFTHLPPGAALERGGAFVLESAVAYLLPAAFLGSIAQIRLLARGFFAVIVLMAGLAAVEAVEGVHFIANTSAWLIDKPEPFVADTRLGLLRARVSFSHQILFGVFCASLFAILWFEARTVRERALRTAACLTGVVFSLSSAAFLLLAMQIGLIATERTTRFLRDPAMVVGTAIGLVAVAVEIAVNGGLVGFVTRYLSLNAETAYYRQLIWLHVTDDILANPLTGTGGPWSRPAWMVESIDHVFFAKAIAYGIPPIALITAAAVVIGRSLFRHPPSPSDGVFRSLRLGWVFCVLGIAVAGLTVDYFGRALPFVMFIIGLGAALDRVAGTGSRGRIS